VATTEAVKKLRELLATGPRKATETREALPSGPSYGIMQKRVVELPGATAFIQTMHELLPGILAELDRALEQEKQTGITLDGFVGDLEKAHNAQVPTEIHCPECGMLHVDQDEWATTRLHRKHLCHGCKHIWAPYAVTTTGCDFHGSCREQIAKLEARRDELLATIAKISQTVPLESEVAEALNQRGALLAEIGTLRAQIESLEAHIHKLEGRETRL
jgi:hypothetical protein